VRPRVEWSWQLDRNELVVGLDEVNYSPSLAGDCVVAACWLPLDRDVIEGVDDSKDLTSNVRLRVFTEIARIGQYCVVPASVSDIRDHGIYGARNIAAETALFGLACRLRPQSINVVVTDRGIPEKLHPKQLRIPGAGRVSYLAGAASIVAKVYMDALFVGYDKFWPGYGLGDNHGNLSDEHLQKLRAKGPTPVHRVQNYGADWWTRILEGTQWQNQ